MVSQEREQSSTAVAEETINPGGEVNLTGDDTNDLDEEDIDMATLLDESMSSMESGSLITGVVLKVTNDTVVVDIGSKSEGLIPLDEFAEEDRDLVLTPGQEVEVMIVKREGRDGLPVLSRKRAKQIAARKHLRDAYKDGTPVRCLIKSVIKGGFEVDVDSLRGFIPFSQMGQGARNKDEQDALVGQAIEAKILEMKNKRDLILSQRVLIEEKRKKLRAETMGALQPGGWFRGVVKNLTDFGAFVDLGGVDGLLHVKDMSWGHVAHPREKVNVGDEVEVMVLSIEGDRISLGTKQRSADPWLSVKNSFPPGCEVSGSVTSLTKYGAFVELQEGVEGLIHLSELSWTKRVKHPSEILKDKEQVTVKVLAIDEDRKRISLSLRQTKVDPWTLARTNYPTGTIIEGEVTGMTDFGAFVRLPEGVDGMIHVSDMSWTDKVNHPKEAVKKGEVIKAKVLEIDPSQQRISLGLKQMEPDPWDSIAQRYRVGSAHTVKVLRIADFGAFVELEEGVEGLVPNSHVSNQRGDRAENVLRVGDEHTMKVIKCDRPNRKISLSLKDFVREQERQEVEQFMETTSGGNATLGELLGEKMKAIMSGGEAPAEEVAPEAKPVAEEAPVETTPAEPVAEEPAVDELSAEEVAPEAASAEEPAVVAEPEEPAPEETAPEDPVAEEPAAEEPAVVAEPEEPAPEETAPEDPVAEEPAAEEPAAEEAVPEAGEEKKD